MQSANAFSDYRPVLQIKLDTTPLLSPQKPAYNF